MTTMNRSGLAQFVLLGLIWGSSYTFIKTALEGLTPAQLGLARLGLGLVFLVTVLSIGRSHLPRSARLWMHLAASSVLGMVIPFLLLGYGEQRTSAAMAGMLIAILPLATMAGVSVFVPSERVTRRKLIGFLLGFLGVATIVGPWRSESGELVGQLAVVGAACSYAAQTVYIKKFLVPHGLSPVVQATAQVISAVVVMTALLPAFTWHTPEVTVPVAISALILGVFATGVAYVLYNKLIRDLGAATASSVNYLVPVVGAVASTTLLGDRITWNMALGTLVVMSGLAVAEGRFKAAKPPAPGGEKSTTRPERELVGQVNRDA